MLIKNQQGIGLLEVLVALLLLAIAVLGFSAMQLRAIQATDETLTRSDAMVIIRNISEDLRLLPTAAQKSTYITHITSATTSASKNCENEGCSPTERVEYNAVQAKLLAKDSNIRVGAMNCPNSGGDNNIQKLCLVASWNETNPQLDDDSSSCADANGTYRAGSSCIIMETY